jgi:hypothetical protein
MRPSSFLDVIDLAGWLVDAGLSGATGTVNAVGEQRRFGDVVTACRAPPGTRVTSLVADPEWLVAQGVQPWMGPRSLPVWTPGPEYAGVPGPWPVGRRDARPARPTAGRLVQSALAWERTLGPAGRAAPASPMTSSRNSSPRCSRDGQRGQAPVDRLGSRGDEQLVGDR